MDSGYIILHWAQARQPELSQQAKTEFLNRVLEMILPEQSGLYTS